MSQQLSNKYQFIQNLTTESTIFITKKNLISSKTKATKKSAHKPIFLQNYKKILQTNQTTH